MLRLLLVLLLMPFTAVDLIAQERYEVRYHLADKDTSTTPESRGLKLVFSSKNDCFIYMENLVKNRKSLGFLSFSIDSIHYDTHWANVWIYMGKLYKWTELKLDPPMQMVAEAAGVHKLLKKTTLDDSVIARSQESMLNWLENNGYPFAAIHLDSLQINHDQITRKWTLEKGPLYKIDSIHVEGNVKISTRFLEQYLSIPPSSIYRKEKLETISSKLRELSFLEESTPWDLTMVGTGATLNLYLQNKRSSQINALIGFLPANKQLGGKTLITGEVKMNLRNAIGQGELIGLNWQQLQVNSPRLNLIYQHPYLFKSGYGIDFQFDVFKKDSSFINLNTIVGLMFQINSKQRGKLFYQRMSSNQISVDTNMIKLIKQLPEQLDLRTALLGIEYQYTGTDYVFNPRKGTLLSLASSVGIRKISKNNFIEALKKDASGQPFSFTGLYDSIRSNSFVFRWRSDLAHFIQTGKLSTIRLALQTGFVFSNGVYRNELFQIGGYKLLRGFNEESIYTDRFVVSSAEYRYLIGQNAFLFAFSDLGWAKTMNRTSYYWGNGFGVSLETKAGFLNLSYALGKQQGTPFSLREGKIHFGFVSIF